MTGTSTNGLKSIVPIRVTVDPTGQMGLAGLLVITTTGFGTGGENNEGNVTENQMKSLGLL